MDQKRKSFLKCKVCNLTYDDEKRKPIVLPCGHTICQECFKRLSANAKNTRIISCPFDRKNYDARNASTNFSLMEAINDGDGSEDLMFYCKNDDVVICTKCVISTQNGGLHEIYSKEDFENQERDLLKELTKQLEEVENRTTELQNFLCSITDKYQDVNTKLNAFRKKVIANVENWCSSYIEKVETHYTEKVELLMQQLEELHFVAESGKQFEKEIKTKLKMKDKGAIVRWLWTANKKQEPFGCTKNNCILFSWEKNQEKWMVRNLADFLVQNFKE